LKFSLSKPDFAESLPSSNASYCTYQEEHYILNGQQNINMAAFNSLKNSLAREVVLTYPDFSIPFKIYTDTSKYQSDL
jgi:hypothetical protein